MPILLAKVKSRSPDMLVIGFQEIVPLTAQQIIQTDPEKRYVQPALGTVTVYLNTCRRRIWENKIIETLDRRPNKTCNYVLLRSEQVIFYLIFFVPFFNEPPAGGNGSNGSHERRLDCRHSKRGGHNTESTLTRIHHYDTADNWTDWPTRNVREQRCCGYSAGIPCHELLFLDGTSCRGTFKY